MTQHWNTFERTLYRRQPQFLTWEGVAIASVVGMVAGLGMTAYSMSQQGGGSAPPPPANSVQYGNDGEVTSSQTFDAKTNTWITRSGSTEPTKPDASASPEDKAQYETDHAKWVADKEQRAAEKQKLSDLRTKMLDNLNTTPEDRVKAYAEYQKAYADSAHSVTDPAFAKMERNANENANSTGMFGSRAYVDTQNELAKDKLTQDQNIADQSVMAKEQLANNDRSYWAGMLNQIDSGARADNLAAAQISKGASDVAAQQYAGTLAQYSAQNALNQQNNQRYASMGNSGSNLAGGLMYLYGNKSSPGSSVSMTPNSTVSSPSGGGVSMYGQKFSLLG